MQIIIINHKAHEKMAIFHTLIFLVWGDSRHEHAAPRTRSGDPGRPDGQRGLLKIGIFNDNIAIFLGIGQVQENHMHMICNFRQIHKHIYIYVCRIYIYIYIYKLSCDIIYNDNHIYVFIYLSIYLQADRQTDRQTDRQIDR